MQARKKTQICLGYAEVGEYHTSFPSQYILNYEFFTRTL